MGNFILKNPNVLVHLYIFCKNVPTYFKKERRGLLLLLFVLFENRLKIRFIYLTNWELYLNQLRKFI